MADPEPLAPASTDANVVATAERASNTRSDEDDDGEELKPTRNSSIYQGLSERSKLWILGMGAIIACANLFVAWWLSYETLKSLQLTPADMLPFKGLIGDAAFSSEQRHDLTERSMHVVALSKMMANKQGVVLACFGGAFALAALGFALFVIGADGAFKVSSSTDAKARLIVSGTAPGLLCFLICGILIQQGVRHKSEVNMPPFSTSLVLIGDKALRNAAGSDDSCKYQVGAKCYNQAQWDEATK